MRLRLLGASAAIVAGLALSACGGSNAGSSANVPSSTGPQTLVSVNGHKIWVRPAPGVKVLPAISCPYSKYSFCFYVTPGNSGPYVSTSDGTAPLYNVATIEKAKSGKVDKKFKTYFYPDPGDPTSQYITYKGKGPKKPGPVKFTDVYCIGFSQYACQNGSGSILYLGIALE